MEELQAPVKREPPLNAPACFAGVLLKGIPALQGREEVNNPLIASAFKNHKGLPEKKAA